MCMTKSEIEQTAGKRTTITFHITTCAYQFQDFCLFTPYHDFVEVRSFCLAPTDPVTHVACYDVK